LISLVALLNAIENWGIGWIFGQTKRFRMVSVDVSSHCSKASFICICSLILPFNLSRILKALQKLSRIAYRIAFPLRPLSSISANIM
jgi:hypothetical protein